MVCRAHVVVSGGNISAENTTLLLRLHLEPSSM